MKKSIKASALALVFLAVLFVGYSIGLHKSDDIHGVQVETLQEEVKNQRTNVKDLKRVIESDQYKNNVQLVEINELAKTVKKLTPSNLDLTIPVYGSDIHVNGLARMDAEEIALHDTQMIKEYFKCLK